MGSILNPGYAKYPISNAKTIKMVPISLKARMVKDALSQFPIQFANTIGSNHDLMVKYGLYTAVPKLPIKKSAKSLHNSFFVVWDIETIGYTDPKIRSKYALEVPVMTAWSMVDKGIIKNDFRFNYNVASYIDNSIKMIEDMLKSITNYVESTDCKSYVGNTIYVFAHNAGKFDLKVMLKALYVVHKSQTDELPVHISDPNHDIYQITIKFGNKYFVFRDSLKLLLNSVAGLNSTMLNGEFGKMPMNLTLLDKIVLEGRMLEKNTQLVESLFSEDSRYGVVEGWQQFKGKYATPHDYFKDYCIMDCEIVAKALIKLSVIMRKELGYPISVKDCLTISNNSMKTWIQKFNDIHKEPVIAMSMNSAVSNFIRKSYMGGRVEVFNSGIGLDKVYHFDVPGMYAICITKDLPIGNPVYLEGFKPGIDSKEFLKQLHANKIIGFFKCQVSCPNDLNIPVLGIHSSNGKLYFPTGNFIGTWTSYELELAVRKGYTIIVTEGYVFKVGNPLKAYSERFTSMKNRAEAIKDTSTRTIAKLYLNSLYGKFASHYFTNSSQVVFDAESLHVLENLYEINSIMDLDVDMKVVNFNINPKSDAKVAKDILKDAYKKSQKALVDKNINMAVASTITSHARILLYSLYMEVEKMGGKLCYSDTDSVFAWLPESPFNKPFGPFTWTGDPNKETAVQALFMAPKMYYFKAVNGDLKFKVKGVSTKGSDYTYEILKDILINKGKITFINQKTFNNLPLKSGAGVIVKEGLSKTYAMLESKRNWLSDGNYMWSVPKYVDLLNEVTASNLLPAKCNDTMLNAILNDKTAVKAADSTQSQVFHHSHQYINTDINYVTINLNTEFYRSEFETVWSHVIATAKLNTNNFNNLDNLKRLQVVAYDSTHNKYVTISYNLDYKWIGYLLADVKHVIWEALLKAEVGYDNAYDFDVINFNIYFNELPKTASPVNFLLTTMKATIEVSKSLPTPLQIKEQIEEKREELKLAELVNERIKPIIEAIMKEEKVYIETFLNKLPNKIDSMKIDEVLDMEYIYDHVDFQRKDIQTFRNKIKFQVYNKIVKSMWMSAINNGFISLHAWKSYLIDELKIKSSDERGVVFVLKAVWVTLKVLQHFKVVKVLNIGSRHIDMESGKYYYSNTTWCFEVELDQMNKIADKVIILSKIRFTPKEHPYDPNSIDPSISSKDKSQQLSKLNAVKVILNPAYANWIYDVKEALITLVYDDLGKSTWARFNNLKNKNQINSGWLEFQDAITQISTIFEFLQTLKTNHYYNLHIMDSRGRVYPKLTNFSHIGSKWLRPLFCLSHSEVKLSDMPIFNKTRLNPFYKADYYVSIATEFNLKLDLLNTNIDTMIQELKKQLTDTINPRLISRYEELKHIKEYGAIHATMPDQLDMKNNALQHISIICQDVEVMKAVGVIESEDPNQLDMYQIVAKELLKEIINMSDKHLSEEILKQLPTDEIDRINTLRKIVKRTVIVISYSATVRTMKQYVYQSLKESSLVLSKLARNFIANTTVEVTITILDKEIQLIEWFKSIIKTEDGALKWGFKGLSDFQVTTKYLMESINEIKLSWGSHQFHTTYKVISDKPNRNKIRLATFVNVIHSLDALNLILFINRKPIFNIFTIHDALLLNCWENKDKIADIYTDIFIEIHKDNLLFANIVQDLSNKAVDTTTCINKWNIKVKENKGIIMTF